MWLWSKWMNECSEPNEIKHLRIPMMMNMSSNFSLGANWSFFKFWDSLESTHNVWQKYMTSQWRPHLTPLRFKIAYWKPSAICLWLWKPGLYQVQLNNDGFRWGWGSIRHLPGENKACNDTRTAKHFVWPSFLLAFSFHFLFFFWVGWGG